MLFEFETCTEGLLLRTVLGGRIELATWKHDWQGCN